MRVALDVTPLLGARTGVGQFVAALLDALPDVPDGPAVAPYVVSRAARGHRDGLPPETVVLPLPAGLLVRLWARADVPDAGRWVGPADVVHGTNFVVPPVRGRPQVVTVHDCWCARNPSSCPPEVRAFTGAVRRAVRRGATVHVGSQFVADEVAEVYGATDVAVVPFGVTPPPATTGPTPIDGRYVLALGRLDHRKNLPRLVRTLPSLPGDVALVLAGPPGDASADVDAAVADLPAAVRGRVRVLGEVSDADRHALLAGAAALAYPSLEEGFGFPVLEAMAAGTPVVAAAVGGVPEVAGDAAALVDPHDSDAIAAALASLLADDARRASLADAGRARAASYSWDATARGLTDLWQRLA